MSGTSEAPDPQHTCGFCPGCRACVVRRHPTRQAEYDPDRRIMSREPRSDPARREWSHLDGTPLCLEEDDAGNYVREAFPVGTRVRPHALAGRQVVTHGRTCIVADYDEAEREVHLLDAADGTYRGRVWLGGHNPPGGLAEQLGLIQVSENPVTKNPAAENPVAEPTDPPASARAGSPVTVVVVTTAAPAAPSGEVSGLRTALSFAAAMAAVYQVATENAETFVHSLHGCGVSGEAIAAAITAVAALGPAARAWQQCHTALAKQLQVTEAYAIAPDAGSREFLTQQ